MSQSFKVGDLVRKRAGYEYPGIIVSVFTTRAGAVRYVVEADHPGFAGMLHIFNGENWSLEPNFLYRNASSRASSRSLMARRDICCGCARAAGIRAKRSSTKIYEYAP